MNNSITRSVTKNESIFSCEQYKKSKTKRASGHKYRNFNLRKKRLKKCYSTNDGNSSISKFDRGCEKNMSNWYWSNYKKAVEWQDRHKIAHWKASALALYEENRYLLQIINSMQPGLAPELPIFKSNSSKVYNNNGTQFKRKCSQYFINAKIPGSGTHNIHKYEKQLEEEQKSNDNIDSDDIEFEMSVEMMQFFEHSYKNKMDLQKAREEELIKTTEQKIKEIQNNKMKRSTEMNLLYGEGASMIIGMETAVQLTFDKYCDTKSPQYWPNIPFRL